MSILDDFLTADSIRFDPIGLDLVDPPMFGPIVLVPAGPRIEMVGCVSKARGRLDVTLSILGFTIAFQGRFLGVDSMGRWLLRWTVDDLTPRRFSITTIRRIRGQVTVSIAPLTPLRNDINTCADTPGEFFVSVSLVQPESLVDRVPNELRVEADLITPIRALVTGCRGDAGTAASPPTPLPQPILMTLSAYCVNSRITWRIFGEVRFDRPILRSHTDFSPVVTAESVSPVRSLEVTQHQPIIGSSSVFFEVLVPPDLRGIVRVSAFTNDRSRIAGAQFHIDPPGGCVNFIDRPMEYTIIPVGCEAWDCGWTGLNDRAELIGRSGGWATRYLTSRRQVDFVGRLVGELAVLRAINNYGTVVGVINHGDSKVDSFVYGEPFGDGAVAPELYWVPNVTLQSLNDEGVAGGIRDDGKRVVAVRWMKGQLEDINIPSSYATTLAIDPAGNIAGVHLHEASGQLRAFVLDQKGFHDLGDLGGDVVSIATNGAGAVAGTINAHQTLRGFIYSPQMGSSEIKLPDGDSDQSVISDINDDGVVVGTVWNSKEGAPRAFRFTVNGGSEDLNKLVRSDQITCEAAIAINNMGQILVLGSQQGSRGYFLLNPASVPTPQIPIP